MWDDLKSEVQYAIETGVSLEEFLLSKDLTRAQWYSIKPKGFKWNKLAKLNKEGEPSESDRLIHTRINKMCHNTICENEMIDNSGLCMNCTNFLLKNIIMLFRKGFTEKVIKKQLG
jgi:hypothetical protein